MMILIVKRVATTTKQMAMGPPGEGSIKQKDVSALDSRKLQRNNRWIKTGDFNHSVLQVPNCDGLHPESYRECKKIPKISSSSFGFLVQVLNRTAR